MDEGKPRRENRIAVHSFSPFVAEGYVGPFSGYKCLQPHSPHSGFSSFSSHRPTLEEVRCFRPTAENCTWIFIEITFVTPPAMYFQIME